MIALQKWAKAQGLEELQTATLNARERSGDEGIGTTVRQGLFQVVRVVKRTVTPLSGWLEKSQAISFLEKL